MSGSGVMAGLADSVFLTDVDARDRDPTRLILTLVGGLAVGLVAGVLVDIAAGGLPLKIQRLLVATAADGTFWLAFVALASIIAHHPLHRYLTAATHVRWRLLGAGMILSALAMAPLVAAERLVTPDDALFPALGISPGLGGAVLYALSALLLIPAAAAEELFFRGWLLRQAAAFTRRPAVLIGLTALVFSGLHRDFSPDSFLTRTLMGAGFAYMTLRLGGIEFSAGVHAVNNILIVLFLDPLTARVAATPELSAATLLEDVALVAGYVLITEAVARSPRLRRWAGVKIEDISGSGDGALRVS